MTEILLQMHEEEAQAQARLRAARVYRLDEEAYALAQSSLASMKQSGLSLLDTLTPPATVGRAPSDCAAFCTSLEKHLSALGVLVTEQMLLTEEERGNCGEHVAYPQNRYTERAYRVLTRRMKRPSVTYTADFAAACAEVRDGLADLCILPLRDGEGAYLRTFLHLLEEYGLSVRAYAWQEDEEGDGTHYALCGRGVCLPERGKTLCIELLLPARSENDAAELMTLTAALGGSILSGELLPDPHTPRARARLALLVGRRRICTFLLALRLFSADSLVYGVSAYGE